MTAVTKQDSNQTGLSLCEEISPGQLNGNASDVWNALEPNTYKDFGPTYKLVARAPINSSRQLRKGVITDMDATAGFQSDLTYDNLQKIAQGVFFADFRTKAELPVASTTASGTDYVVAANGTDYAAGDLLFAKNFTDAANNGLKVVSGSTATTVVSSTGGLVDSTGQTGTISRVGVEFASGDATFDITGAYPALLTTTKDLTTLGLLVGEWVFVGDDGGSTQFATQGCNGFARIYSIAAHKIEFDKLQNVAATDAGTGKTIRVFFGRVVKNELSADQVRRTYQLERTLGKDDTGASNDQAEYATRSVLDNLVLTFNSADKVTWDITTVSGGYETRTSADGPKPGSRPAPTMQAAFNTTSHVKRMSLAKCGANISPLYAFLLDASVTVKNNTTLDKALGHLGGFDTTSGNFEVSCTIDAYFATVDAANSIKNNDSCTFDAILCRDNVGIVIDLPLVTLGGGMNKVAANSPITLNLANNAATGADFNANADYTAMIVFFDYVPTLGM